MTSLVQRMANRKREVPEETKSEPKACCRSCESPRILTVGGDFRDLGFMDYTNGQKSVEVIDDYLPGVPNINDEGEVCITVCMNCGQVQGEFPVQDEEILSGFEHDDDY